MISEASLKRHCTPAVLSRAKRIVGQKTHLHARKCRYEDGQTILNAKADATGSWDAPHRVSIVLDEDADALVDYGCDCDSSLRMSSACKHVMALALDFNESPESYEGYDCSSHLATSRGVAKAMRRAEEDLPLPSGTSTEPHDATVSLEPTLVRDTGFLVRFRLQGAQGSYVLKSITDFVDDVVGGVYQSYGKRLSFVHDLDAFCEGDRAVVAFLVHAVQNMRAYVYERAMGRAVFGGATSPMREMRLSPPELIELLGLYEGRTIAFEDHGASVDGEPARMLRVELKDPQFELELVPLDGGAYEVRRPRGMRVTAYGGRAIAWDGESLNLCSRAFSRHASLLVDLLSSSEERLVVGERDLGRFCATVLPRLDEVAQTTVPQSIATLKPVACELEFHLDCGQRGIICVATAVYGERRVMLVTGRALDQDEGEPMPIVRDGAKEARGREVVRKYLSMDADGNLSIARTNAEAMARFLYEGVPELQRLGTVFATEAFERLHAKTRPRVRVGLSVRSNLLEVTFDVDGASAADLAGLLKSYALKKRYHRLRDGSFVDLSQLDMEEAAAVAQELDLTPNELANGHANVAAYRALLLDEHVHTVHASVEQYLSRIRSVDPSAYVVPSRLAKTLRPYQRVGFGWLSALCDLGLGGVLADEMGLGKSLQLISFLCSKDPGSRSDEPSLVVCPASLVYNWQAEFERFAPWLKVRVVAGDACERQSLLAARGVDVFVTSYDLLRRDAAAYASLRFWCVALDEAQYIKNHETIVAHTCKELDAHVRFALTGTPVENRLSELWSIFDFLMPGLLGTYDRFRERYERPILDGDDELSQSLGRAIKPFILRRTKREVLQDLPEKIEQVVRVRMGVEQRLLYEAQVQELRDQMTDAMDAPNGGKLQVLVALTRLRQICCDPSLVFEGYDAGSCKTEALLTLVARAIDAGQKMLVFSQFTSYLQIVSAQLREQGIAHYVITGSTPKRKRVELVDLFNQDDTPVFLISLKAGGTGLNLTGASVVVHADPWWNAAAQNQATDRAHRIGQTQDVTVYKLIAAKTVEDRILELQRAKSRLADAVVAGDSTGISLANLTREDLEELLG